MPQDNAAGRAKTYVLLVSLLLVVVVLGSAYHLSGGHASTRRAGDGCSSALDKGSAADETSVTRREREGVVSEWQKAWAEAPRNERIEIGKRIAAKEVLIGLSSEKVLSVLGPPDHFFWGSSTYYSAPYYYHAGFEDGIVVWSTGGGTEPARPDRAKATAEEGQDTFDERGSTAAPSGALDSPQGVGEAGGERRFPGWVMAWQNGTPDKRRELAKRMAREEPFRGLGPRDCIRILGSPQVAMWYCGRTTPIWSRWHASWHVSVYFDGSGSVSDVDCIGETP